MAISRICVYCASSPGNRAEFADAALSLGTLVAERASPSSTAAEPSA